MLFVLGSIEHYVLRYMEYSRELRKLAFTIISHLTTPMDQFTAQLLYSSGRALINGS